MANYKKQDHYYVCYPNGVRIEVSEEVYRVWAYGFKATPHKVHKLEIKHD